MTDIPCFGDNPDMWAFRLGTESNMVCLFNRLTQIHPTTKFQSRSLHNGWQTYHVSLIIQTWQRTSAFRVPVSVDLRLPFMSGFYFHARLLPQRWQIRWVLRFGTGSNMVCLFNDLTQIHPTTKFQARPVHNTRQTYHVSLIIQTCQVWHGIKHGMSIQSPNPDSSHD